MKILAACTATLLAFSLVAIPVAEAKRLGGGMNLGKQYSTPHTPSQQIKPLGPTATPPAGIPNSNLPSPTRSAGRWFGPLAGLAAGGLLASLLLGDGFQGLRIMDILLIALFILGGFMLFRFMRRGVTSAPTGVRAGSVGGNYARAGDIPPQSAKTPVRTSDFSSTAGEYEHQAPTWFDPKTFAEGAKSHFRRLQDAWDRADFSEIKAYTTPKLYAELQRERMSLGQDSQITDVVVLNVQIVGTRRDGNQAFVSLEFYGMIREGTGEAPNPFREIWHIQHTWNTPEGDWFIAGIQQTEQQSPGIDGRPSLSSNQSMASRR